MEKYARQALSEGAKSDTELHVTEDSELYRVISLHYNRNNHIEVRTHRKKTEPLSLGQIYRFSHVVLNHASYVATDPIIWKIDSDL